MNASAIQIAACSAGLSEVQISSFRLLWKTGGKGNKWRPAATVVEALERKASSGDTV